MPLEKLVILVARKKVVFVIVEGPSDDTALSLFFNRIYDKNTVHVDIRHGDITSDYNIPIASINKALTDIVKNYANSMHFKKSDFQEVIHIVDMDGAYVGDECIVYDDVDEIQYLPDEIRCLEPEKMIERNDHKRKKLDKIQRLTKIWGTVDYQVYYMSCNLEHVLFDKMNCSDKEKEILAHQFSKKYKDHIADFVDFMCDSQFSVTDSYLQSWKFIKNDNESLHRHSNLGICLKKAFINNKNNE